MNLFSNWCSVRPKELNHVVNKSYIGSYFLIIYNRELKCFIPRWVNHLVPKITYLSPCRSPITTSVFFKIFIQLQVPCRWFNASMALYTVIKLNICMHGYIVKLIQYLLVTSMNNLLVGFQWGPLVRMLVFVCFLLSTIFHIHYLPIMISFLSGGLLLHV